MVGRGSGGDVPVFPRGFVTIVIVVAVVWSDEYPIERGHERYGARDREFTDVDREFSIRHEVHSHQAVGSLVIFLGRDDPAAVCGDYRSAITTRLELCE